MKQYISYFIYLMRHKWYVFQECVDAGILLRGLLHDLSKFRLDEFIPYANYYYGSGDEKGVKISWLFHQKRNDHHWQYWILMNDDGTRVRFKLPEPVMKEMVCDWKGMSKTLRYFELDDTLRWYLQRKNFIDLHPDTAKEVEEMLGYYHD